MRWIEVTAVDQRARAIADRHCNRQKVGSKQFAPPGRKLVLITESADALWITSWPFAEYVRHAWAGAFVNSCFRNESAHLSSSLIREAMAATLWKYPVPPPLGMITFVDPGKVRKKRDFGRCYLKAGFKAAACPKHAHHEMDCSSCASRTVGGLVALQMLPAWMPPPMAPLGFPVRGNGLVA